MTKFNEENYKEENFDYYLSGTQARKLVQGLKNNPAKYGKVILNVRTAVWHQQRTEVGESGAFEDDTYGDTYYMSSAAGSVPLPWKNFLETCKSADDFSALKQEGFAENGEANNTSEHGTGINIRYSTSEYGFTLVYVG
jgi:hypothetical protein